MTRQLRITGNSLFPVKMAEEASKLDITPEILFRSMERLKYTTNIDSEIVQETIDYVTHLGYIKSSFKAEDILDLSFIKP